MDQQQNQQPDIQQNPDTTQTKNPWESFTEQQEAEFQKWSKGLQEDYYNTDKGRRSSRVAGFNPRPSSRLPLSVL